MMPGTTDVSLSEGPLRPDVDVFGERSPRAGAARVEIRLSACLSFWELLGVFSYALPASDGIEDIEQASVLRDGLHYCLLDNDLETIEYFAECAERAWVGGGTRQDPSGEYLRKLGKAITRVFGVAPEAVAQ